jgi:hypothetical protein
MRDIIEGTVAAVMKKNGFRRKSKSWYLRTDDTILVVNLQKSIYGDQYYVNLAVWLKALGENVFPKEYHCHIRSRVVAFDRDRQKYWEREVFDLDNTDMPDAERSQQIQSFLEEKALPFLLSCGSVEELRKLYREGRFEGIPVLIEAQKFLGESA